MSLLDQLVCHWRLDETSTGAGAVSRVDAHGGITLTDNNTVASAAGKLGNAADFESANTGGECLSSTDNPSLSLSTDTAFTWACWFNAESLTGLTHRPLVIKSTGGDATSEYQLYWTSNVAERFEFMVGNNSTFAFVSLPYAASGTGAWHLIIAWHDPVLDKLFLQLDNGTPAEAAWSAGTFNGTGAFNIGRFPFSTGLRWDGLIDSLSLWKRPLTSNERLQLWNGSAGLDYAAFGNALASGGLGTITLSAPQATAAVAAPVFASGDIGTINLLPPAASALVDAFAAGNLGTITLLAPEGTAIALEPGYDGNAAGEIGTIFLTPPRGTATGKKPPRAVSTMGLLLKTERAWQRLLKGNVSYLVSDTADFIVTDLGVRILLESGFNFFLPILRGQDEVEVAVPAVIASCPSGFQVENATTTHIVDNEISIYFPADPGTHQQELLVAFEDAADGLMSLLYRDDIPQELTDALEGFTCQFAPGVWTQESGWFGEQQRLRVYKFSRRLIVTPVDFLVGQPKQNNLARNRTRSLQLA